LSTNVGDKNLRENGHLLLIGTCIQKRFPDVVEKYAADKAVLHVCLEDTHMNHAGYKIASMVSYAALSTITALTIDGSPHCVQLHYLIEDIKSHFAPQITTHHFVVEKGEVLEISPTAVKRSRHLSKIEKMIS
jgi:hypothetical protein